MKPKDVICIVGAPIKTTAEIVLGIAVACFGIGGVFLIVVLLENYFHGMKFFISDKHVAWIVFGFIGSILGLIPTLFFIGRTHDNYLACKKYWN